MLQIIGWLGCVYLIVKALEIAANRANYDHEGYMRSVPLAATIIAWLGAIGFAIWLLLQGGAMHDLTSQATYETPQLDAAEVQCINAAKSPEEVIHCGRPR